MQLRDKNQEVGLKYDKGDFYLSLFIAAQTLLTIIQIAIPYLDLGISVDFASSFRILGTIITAIPAVLYAMKRNGSLLLKSLSVFFLVLVLTYWLYPYSRRFIEGGDPFKVSAVGIIMLVCISAISDIALFYKILLVVLRLTAIIGIVFGITYLRHRDIMEENYLMSFSYVLYLPIMYLFTTGKLYDVFLSLFCFVLITLIGSRGATLFSVIFFVIYILFLSSQKIGRKLMLVLLCCLATYLLSSSSFATTSRTLTLLSQGEFISHDSGRLELYAHLKEFISQRPISGWGIGSDRALLKDTEWAYCHNIVYDLFLSCGIPLGLLIMGIFLVRFIKSIKKTPDHDSLVFLITMLFAGLVPLFVSSSVWTSTSMALFLGFILRINKKRNESSISY